MPSHYNIFQSTFGKGITVQAFTFRDDRTIVHTCMTAWEKHSAGEENSHGPSLSLYCSAGANIHSGILTMLLLLSPASLCHVHPK